MSLYTAIYTSKYLLTVRAELAELIRVQDVDLADAAVGDVDLLVDPGLGPHQARHVLAVRESCGVALGHRVLHLADRAGRKVLGVDEGTDAAQTEHVVAGQALERGSEAGFLNIGKLEINSRITRDSRVQD